VGLMLVDIEFFIARAGRTLLAEQAMHLLVPREKNKSGA